MTNKRIIRSAFFITFKGDCKKALTLYQTCFGGKLFFNTLDMPIDGMEELPIVSASLISDKISIYGSDLVHDEGRKTGNYISAYIQCDNHRQRMNYIEKLKGMPRGHSSEKYAKQKLIEITDRFDVRWIFGCNK